MHHRRSVFAGTWAVVWVLGGILATAQGWRGGTSPVEWLGRFNARGQVMLLVVVIVATLVNGFVSWRLAKALTRPGQAHPQVMSVLAAAGFAFGSWFLPVMLYNTGVYFAMEDGGGASELGAPPVFGWALLVATMCSLIALVTAAGRLQSRLDPDASRPLSTAGRSAASATPSETPDVS